MAAQDEKGLKGGDAIVKEIGKAVDEDDTGLMEMPDCLCMACGESGTTRMILTKIPFFQEVIVSSFECDTCAWKNNTVQFGGEIKEKGCRFELKVTDPKDLDRQVIKSDTGSIFIPELELEIPAKTQQGSINTIEGVFQAMIDGLQEQQEHRREVAPEVADKVESLLARVSLMKIGSELPFTFIVEDPSGNSFVENPHAPRPDPHLRVSFFDRTPMQDLAVGLQPTQAAREAGYIDESRPEHRAPHARTFEGLDKLMAVGSKAHGEANGGGGEGHVEDVKLGRTEAITFPEVCPNCQTPGQVVNCVTDIPFFKEVIIMAFDCEHCGFRNNEIKGGGAIPLKGTRVTLRVERHEDFARDVLKSDTAGIRIPELDLSVVQGSLGGFFSSVEGLLQKIREHLKEGNPFGVGDSSWHHHADPGSEEQSMRAKFGEFMAQLDEVVEGRRYPFTLILEDPLGNSYIKFSGMRPEDDAQVHTEDYERTWDEDEALGLHDMATEGFETGYEGQQRPEVSELRSRPQHQMGADHPTPFTKGCVDATASPPRPPKGQQGPEEGAPPSVPPGPSGGADGESAFEPAEAFAGPRPGWAFKSGPKGLGYYQELGLGR